MRYFFLILFFLITFGANAEFLPFTQDVPLMPDLILQEDYLSFDTPSGQILNLTAKTSLPCQQVLSFYTQALPVLGWQEEKTGIFTRNRDTLSLSCTPKKVTFEITFENPS